MRNTLELVEVDSDRLEEVVRRAEQSLDEEDAARIRDVLESYAYKPAEPNSALGGAIGYTLKHWEELTLFLRQAGAPLDNNICERALKKAILHRKNALFDKTRHGAQVGDMFMSLIYTCQLCEANPFDDLAELRQAEVLAACPERWMPWNYCDAEAS